MEYKAIINEQDILEIEITGMTTYEDQDRFSEETDALSEILKKRNKPILVLVNINQIKFPGAEVRKRSSEMLKSKKFDKIAVYATNRLTGFTANLISIAAGMNGKFKAFTAREEALKWLTENNNS